MVLMVNSFLLFTLTLYVLLGVVTLLYGKFGYVRENCGNLLSAGNCGEFG